MISLLLFAYELQEFFVIHLLICNILAVMDQGVIRYRSRSILCRLPAFDMDRTEWDIVLFRSLLQDRNVFCIERALACVVQNIPFLICMRVLCTFFELGNKSVLLKREVPELDTVVCFIAYSKALILQINGFFLGAHRIQSPFLPFFLLSSMQAFRRSLEYPCPLKEPDTHRQSMYI